MIGVPEKVLEVEALSQMPEPAKQIRERLEGVGLGAKEETLGKWQSEVQRPGNQLVRSVRPAVPPRLERVRIGLFDYPGLYQAVDGQRKRLFIVWPPFYLNLEKFDRLGQADIEQAVWEIVQPRLYFGRVFFGYLTAQYSRRQGRAADAEHAAESRAITVDQLSNGCGRDFANRLGPRCQPRLYLGRFLFG